LSPLLLFTKFWVNVFDVVCCECEFTTDIISANSTELVVFSSCIVFWIKHLLVIIIEEEEEDGGSLTVLIFGISSSFSSIVVGWTTTIGGGGGGGVGELIFLFFLL